jgi:ubiquinone/menaquinone biosynthesis C-methylase UbiE
LERPGSLLDWGGYDPTKHNLLDLCGGTGAVSRVARARGGEATLLDLNPRCPDRAVQTLKGRAEDLAVLSGDRSWNFVVCRQALSYLDLPELVRALYCSMTRGGAFICNAFVKPKWSVHPYRFNGRWYLEASGYWGKRVFHLQAMRGDYDVTAFRWYSTHEIVKAFAPCFVLEHFDEAGPSLRFLFRRK